MSSRRLAAITPAKRSVAGLPSLFDSPEQPVVLPCAPGPRAIESDDFPFEAISGVAELESWRKEINRPLYHIHKWWAQRLGTVFRAITLGVFAPEGADILDLLYQPVRIPDATVFDPFMGSGTTVGEALKLGTKAIGRDINPVAHFLVRNALAKHDRKAVAKCFAKIEADVADGIRRFYRARLEDGREADVLYFFWVKQVVCPDCKTPIDLFSSRIFAKHAYPKKYPKSQSVCPHCSDIVEVAFDATEAKCQSCRKCFNPQIGPARGQKAHCAKCKSDFLIAKAVRTSAEPPSHRLYGKLVLTPDGKKVYRRADDFDLSLYSEAAVALSKRHNAFPVVKIEEGFNTNQVLRYNYRHWHEMFNARQLNSLAILADRIRQVPDPVLRDLMTCLFSGTLEFNNMFASYKGEGTGAVRHMFSHHILKPERTPLEANIWGTPRSSGAFSTLFDGRIRRALEYADDPFELRVTGKNGRKAGEKVFGLSEPVGFEIASTFEDLKKRRVFLSCGDSSSTGMPNGSVDAVITDPPFFDNVHYSQLADFFHVWQRHILGQNGHQEACSTRACEEVQNSDREEFTMRLSAVLTEAHRVLKDDGVMALTYHHSRSDGWRSILEALMNSGFVISAVQPVKAEMAVAMPKSQAKEPIDLDIIIVCRKRLKVQAKKLGSLDLVVAGAGSQIKRLRASGRKLSRNDVRIILMSQALKAVSCGATDSAIERLDEWESEIEERIDRLFAGMRS
jgi:putative DNA methylase